MSDIAPGWYRDPVDPALQRYWDGDGYLGDPLPADATPPPGPPAVAGPPSAVPGGLVSSAPSQVTAPHQGPVTPPHSPTPHSPTPHSPTPHSPTPHSPTAPHIPTPPPHTPPPHPAQPGSPGPFTPPLGSPPVPAGGIPGWPAYPKLVLPAPRPHGYRLAGLGARFTARLVDTLAVLGLNIVVNGYFVYQYYKVNLPFWREIRDRFYAGQSTTGVEPPERGSTLLIIILVLAAALWFAYEVPAHASTGQTLGKRLLGIKVMRLESDEQLGFRRSIRRWNTIGLPTLLWTCFGLGFVLQLVDCLWATIDRPMHQALHDKSAVTVVVQAEPASSPNQQPNHDPHANQTNDQQERPA